MKLAHYILCRTLNHEMKNTQNKKIFLTCFIGLVTTSFGFILRAITLPEWGDEFNLTNTQVGEIAGVGLWPFAISIVLFSLVIDKVGYKTALIFAVICHILSATFTFLANGYIILYIATFIMALGNGAIEAAINPVVASMYPKEKTKWMNILHAGWPVGLVLAGILAIFLGTETGWRLKIMLVLIPALTYGIMCLPLTFPKNERIKAGVSYIKMLKEVGIGGALIIVALIIFQLGEVFHWHWGINLSITVFIVSVFGFFVRTIGQPVFIILLLIMIPLATTELGTDSWITDLMTTEMSLLGINAGWILVYTSTIMALLRLFAGRFIHRISPLGLLVSCSAIAAIGLYLLSGSSGLMIFVAATIFGVGKTFFWPTMLGIVGERFPKGGALTLNITGGVGMIGAGVIGAAVLGFIQDKKIDQNLLEYDGFNKTSLHVAYVIQEKQSLFGDYKALDFATLSNAPTEDQNIINKVEEIAKKDALKIIATIPVGMMICYLLLLVYFKKQGGYEAVVLTENLNENQQRNE